jgi:nucleotide-binding universal stress UspA family protein
VNDRRNILAGVAFRADSAELSEGSLKAARQAAWLAKVNGGRLVLLHSTHPDERDGKGDGRIELTGDEHGTLESLTSDLAREFGSCELQVVEGKAWREITKRVLADSVDLVVVGKRNDRGGEGPRLGSVASKLLRSCPGPVWCVRPEHDLAMRLVLAASDLSPIGTQVCTDAAWIARQHACELHLLHAYTPPNGGDQAPAMRARAKELLLGSVAEPSPTVHTVKGKASAAVREAVEHLGPDLLVMGAVSRGEAGHLLGDTAERIVSRVGCSLLTIKPDDFVSPLS